MLAKFAEKVGMTQEGREFVTAAIDPFHDTPLKVCGFPDGNRDPVAVQIVKQSFNIACPSGITTGTWDAQLVLLPWNKNLKLSTQAFLGGTNSNPTNEMIVTSSGVSLTAGGLMAISVPTGTSFNPGVAPPASNTIVYQPFVIPDQYLQGDTRIIGKAFEVHNTTSALNIQGMATTWSIPVPDIETSGLYQWELDTSGTFTLVTPVSAQQIPAWPASQSAAVLTPGARQWTAAQGSYVVARLQSNNIPVSDTGFPIQPFLSFGDTSQSNLNLAPSPNTGTNTAIKSFNNVFWDNTEMCGVVFSGLSLQSTLTINVNWIVERHPDTTISDLVVLAKPPPERDDIALTMYSHLSAALPTGVPVAENGFGDWFMDALSTAADIITPVTSLLPGIGGVISKGISSVNDSYKASKLPKAVAKQIAEEVVEEKYETNPFVKPPTRPMWDANFNNHGVLTETLVGGTKAQRVAARQRAAEINLIRRNHTKPRRSVNPFKGNSIPR
jgi:hypothetical protein